MIFFFFLMRFWFWFDGLVGDVGICGIVVVCFFLGFRGLWPVSSGFWCGGVVFFWVLCFFVFCVFSPLFCCD